MLGGTRREDRQARRQQMQPYLDGWDHDKSDQRRLWAGAVLTGLVCLVALIRWLWL